KGFSNVVAKCATPGPHNTSNKNRKTQSAKRKRGVATAGEVRTPTSSSCQAPRRKVSCACAGCPAGGSPSNCSGRGTREQSAHSRTYTTRNSASDAADHSCSEHSIPAQPVYRASRGILDNSTCASG